MVKERYNKKGRNMATHEPKDTNLVIPKRLSPQELIDAVDNHVQGMSKKKRKRLEKFVEKKRKKFRRTELLECLKQSSVVYNDMSKSSRLGQKNKIQRPDIEIEDDSEDLESQCSGSSVQVELSALPPAAAAVVSIAAPSVGLSTSRPLDPSCILGQADNLVVKNTRKFKIPERNADIQSFRDKLPIIQYEHDIMEKLMSNDVVIVCGATGSGKSTQIGQFCWEYGYSIAGRICVTQPRKVAAITIANRVQEELLNCKTGFKVRHESNIDASTELVYMTDGILLKEMTSDLLLSKYSVVVIDEAHERNINTDILIGLLSRVVKLRRSNYEKKNASLLKVVVMSATLRVHDFTENTKLFQIAPPVINVPARMHPVVVHFNRITPNDYISAIVKKTIHIHEHYPPGGILIFLSGQKEVELTCQLLNQKYGDSSRVSHPKCVENDLIEIEDLDLIGYSKELELVTDDEEPIAILGQLDDQEKRELLNTGDYGGDVIVLPLFSVLSNEEQIKCFLPVKDGQRLIVVATNIAETSITIPNIKYVVDSGKVKNKTYNETTGMYQFKVQWTSKSSAEQRLGRCGRTEPGHCFRIFSSTVFEHQFVQYSVPEILSMPIENVILHLKSMGIDNIHNFPFPTSPSAGHIGEGIKLLTTLKALDESESITEDGLLMSKFPVNARYSRVLISCLKSHSLRYAVTMISILSAQPFESNKHHARKLKSDILSKLFTICGMDYSNESTSKSISSKVMTDIRQIRSQLVKMLNKLLVNGFKYDLKLTPPSISDLNELKKALLTGFLDNVAVSSKVLENTEQLPATNIVTKQGVKCGLPLLPNEMVAYSDLVNTYANNATLMPLGWLGSHCLHYFSSLELIKEPMPIYDNKLDSLLGYVSGTLPNTSYKPPIFQINLNTHFKDLMTIQKYLLFLMLNGQVSEPFASLKKHLITQPHVLINKSVFVSKALVLMQLMQRNKIKNIRDLCNKWRTEPLFMLAEVLPFYKESSHQYIRALWPPFDYDNKIQITAHHRGLIKKLNSNLNKYS
eukprot:NODE_61_length_25240_cov_0.547194.p1 type:complete len:1030 gc:universal NODE_61_length_25240_cov_0.547194:25018-21929(-)